MVEFADMQQMAVVRQKLVIKANELIFPSINVRTENSARPNLGEQLDDIANKNLKQEIQFSKDKGVRVQIDSRKLSFMATNFSVGYDKDQVEKTCLESNPAIFCGFNCNFKENVKISDIHVKGFAPFL